MEIIQKGMMHIGTDKAHQERAATLEERTGESQQQWIERMQGEFAMRCEDQAVI